MLSSVSKLADKNFIIGFFLPSLLGVVSAMQIFPCPSWAGKVCAATAGAAGSGHGGSGAADAFADLTFFAVAVWIMAILLMALNYFEYRLAEGYLPPLSWLEPLRAYHRWKLRRLNAHHDKLKESGNFAAASVLQWNILARYPRDEARILPTRFGNTVRAFEMYPADVYGADSITIWLRLGSVIPKGFQELINGARAQVDFFVNIWFLAWILALAVFARAIAERFHWANAPVHDAFATAIPIAVCLFVAYVSYTWALGRVIAWGDMVKSAFDCYLPALAKQLGYALPPGESARRDFWTDFSRLAIYRHQMTDKKWTLISDPPASQAGASAQQDEVVFEAGVRAINRRE